MVSIEPRPVGMFRVFFIFSWDKILMRDGINLELFIAELSSGIFETLIFGLEANIVDYLKGFIELISFNVGLVNTKF